VDWTNNAGVQGRRSQVHRFRVKMFRVH